jgi:hypothetical protein
VYHDLLADRHNIVRAEVTSAEPLSPQRVAAIEQKLAAVTGKKVSMTTNVNKDIIGGVVARVGSTVYDASIATQLRKIREMSPKSAASSRWATALRACMASNGRWQARCSSSRTACSALR